ncbi:MAG: ABC transporter ATP-binding protein [Anaerolineales bacterium]|nr:ABC transporter ATP-binding protein [Anaerolineales bacterium]
MAQQDFVIKIDGITKKYGETQALKGVDLQVRRNSIYGFLGPNGAGKTTLMKILLRLVRPTSGRAAIFGMDIQKESVAIRERIGYLPQHPRFIEYMTARENLIFTAKFFFSGPEFKLRERCDEMLAMVGLESKADRAIKGFSGGEKQRLGIALAQVNYPDLLILDEPASALDPLGRQAVLEIMDRLREHTTIFYSTHILDDVQRVSDTVAILNSGKIVASGAIEQILNGQNGTIYNVIVKGNPLSVVEKLNQIPWISGISNAKLNGNHVLDINILDEAKAEKHLLRTILSDPEIIVAEYSRKKFELEEVFMDIIKGEQ